jgi:hypothetical protein
VPKFLTTFGVCCWNLELQSPIVSLFTGFAIQLDPKSLHESMDLQTNSRRMMELRENNIGQELEFGSCNLHDS